MDDLSNAQILGGVAVEITANLGGLRAGVNEARNVAQAAERQIRVTIPVRLEASAVRAELPRLLASVQAAVRPIVVPVQFRIAGGGSSIAGLLPGPSMGGGGGMVTAGGGGGMIGGGGNGSYSISSASGSRWQGGALGSSSSMSAAGAAMARRMAPGASASGGGVNSLAIGFLSAHLMTRALGAVGDMAGEFDRPELRNTSALGIARMWGQSSLGSLESERRGIAALTRAGEHLPILGNVVGFADNWSGFGRAQAANELAFEKARDAYATVPDIQSGARATWARLRGDEGAAIRAEGEIKIREMKGTIGTLAAGGQSTDVLQKELNNLRSTISYQAGIADTAHEVPYRQENERYQVANLRARSVRERAAGDLDQAALVTRSADRQSLIDSQTARLDGITDTRRRGHISAANTAELKAFDDESERQSVQREKAMLADVTTAQGAAQAAMLRNARDSYKADLVAFDANAKAKLSLIEDLKERQNEAVRLAAQRSEITSAHAQGEVIDTLTTAGSVAASGLRAQRRNYEADRIAYSAAFNARVMSAQTPEARLRAAAEGAAGYNALLAEQAFQRQQLGYSLSARSEVAGLQADYRPIAGGLTSRARALQAEIRAADPSDQSAVRKTAVAEMLGAAGEIKRQAFSGYATAYDPRMDHPGGLGPNRERTEELLKLIADLLSDIKTGKGTSATTNAPAGYIPA